MEQDNSHDERVIQYLDLVYNSMEQKEDARFSVQFAGASAIGGVALIEAGNRLGDIDSVPATIGELYLMYSGVIIAGLGCIAVAGAVQNLFNMRRMNMEARAIDI